MIVGPSQPACASTASLRSSQTTSAGGQAARRRCRARAVAGQFDERQAPCRRGLDDALSEVRHRGAVSHDALAPHARG